MQGRAGARFRRFLAPLTVSLLTFLAFLPALANEFVNWDDAAFLLDVPQYRGLGWEHLRWMFTAFHSAHYQPLTSLTYGLDFHFWGLEPLGYHLTSILLHTGNALLFYLLCLRLLARDATQAADVLGAALAALLFALHPLRVESVAWISERRDVLSGFFYLLTVHCWLRGVRTPDGSRRLWAVLAWSSYLLALLSKAMVVTLPAVLVILDIYPLGRLSGSPADWLDGRYRAVWREKIAFAVPALAFAALAFHAQAESRSLVSWADAGWIDRAAQALLGLSFYLWKTLLPLRLSPLYEWYWQSEPLRFVLGGALAAAVTGAVVLMRRPAVSAAYAAYVVTLLPVLGIVKSGPQTVADRYSYLACLPLAVLAGAGARNLARRWTDGRHGGQAAISVVAVAALMGGLSWLTFRQISVWRDSISLWSHALRLEPASFVARINLGAAYFERGRRGEAVLLLDEHMQIHPRDSGSGLEAIRITARKWETLPEVAKPHNDAGVARSARGEWDMAVWHFRKALRLDPSLWRTHNNLGLAHYRQGRFKEAVESYEECLRLAPRFAEGRTNLGIALMRLGRSDEAVAHFKEAVARDPSYQPARDSLNRARNLRNRNATAPALRP